MSQYTPQTHASSSQNNASPCDMDIALPQMESFDFDRLDPVALEQTLAYLRANPEPRHEDVEAFSYQGMLADAMGEQDWMTGDGMEGRGVGLGLGVAQQKLGNQSRFALGKLKRCSWDECETQMSSPDALAAHFEIHASHASALFTPPSTCTWQGCSSKAVFKTLASYKSHLRNIHTHPLVCTTPGCSYKKPFRNHPDLERHDVTAHSKTLKFICPYDSCEAEVRSFARKDKWLKHIQETEHQNDAFCPFYHCALEQRLLVGGFTTRKEISKHFDLNHPLDQEDGYQCGLGSCRNHTSAHRWSRDGLKKHLKSHHGIEIVYLPMDQCDETGSKVMLVDHLSKTDSQDPWENFTTQWHDCTICAPPNDFEDDASLKNVAHFSN